MSQKMSTFAVRKGRKGNVAPPYPLATSYYVLYNMLFPLVSNLPKFCRVYDAVRRRASLLF